MNDRITDAIEGNDLDELLRIVDALCDTREWDALVNLRDRARLALERGRQLWPAASHAEYRLALEAPDEYAAEMLVEGAGHFALGPIAEVAASTHTWAGLAPHARAARSPHSRRTNGSSAAKTSTRKACRTHRCSGSRSRAVVGSRRIPSRPTRRTVSMHPHRNCRAAGRSRCPMRRRRSTIPTSSPRCASSSVRGRRDQRAMHTS